MEELRQLRELLRGLARLLVALVCREREEPLRLFKVVLAALTFVPPPGQSVLRSGVAGVRCGLEVTRS